MFVLAISCTMTHHGICIGLHRGTGGRCLFWLIELSPADRLLCSLWRPTWYRSDDCIDILHWLPPPLALLRRRYQCLTAIIRYDTIEEFNVNSKAECNHWSA